MKHLTKVSATLGLLLVLINQISGYKILIGQIFGSRSHKFAIDPVALELAKRGHDVTFITGTESIKNSTNLHNVFVPEVKRVMDSSGISFFDGKVTDTNHLKNLVTLVENLTIATYSYPLVSDILNQPLDSKGNPKYDLLVVDGVFNEFMLPLAQRLGIPTVYLSPTSIFPAQAWALNIPHPYSYIPSMNIGLTGAMSFATRAFNTAFNMFFMLMRNYFLLPHVDEVIHKFYPEARPIGELESEVSFMLTNTHISIHTSIPTMPYYVEVGGLNLVPAKALPKELEDFMQSSGEHGVIYFSLGSYTKGESMPVAMRDKTIEAFGKLSQKVLWKYEQEIEGLPKNIKLTKWAPQQDILAHPKMRLFITHGGGMSTQEAAYHACPILGFPLSADQGGNIANAVDKGFGESLDWRKFSSDDLLQTITKVISNKRYKDTVSKISELLKDRPQPPVETAAYWIEYVIRHKGAPHLKSGAENLNFFQYFLLDVIGVVAIILYLGACIICFIVRKVLSFFGINCCKFSLCQKIWPSGWCSKNTRPAQKPSSKGHKKNK